MTMITELSEPDLVAAAATGRGYILIRDGRIERYPFPYDAWAREDGAQVTVVYDRTDGPATVKQVSWHWEDAKGRPTWSLNRVPVLWNAGGRVRPPRPLTDLLKVFDRERPLPAVGDQVRVDPNSGSYNRGQLGEVIAIEDSHPAAITVRVRFTSGPDEGWATSYAPSDLIAPGQVDR